MYHGPAGLQTQALALWQVIMLAGWLDWQYDWPDWASNIRTVSHCLLVLNSSVNFIIYSWKDTRYNVAIIKTNFVGQQ